MSWSFKKDRLMNRCVWALSFGLVIAVGAFAQSLPDEIDYRTYEAKYLKSKAISDDKRGAVNRLIKQLEEKSRAIEQVQKQIQDTENEIQRLESRDVELEQNNQNLLRRNQDLLNERIRQLGEIATLQRQLRDLQDQINRSDQQITDLNRELEEIKRRLDTVLNQTTNTRSQYDSKTNQRNQLATELSRLQGAQQNVLARRQRLTEEARNLQAALASLPGEIARLEASRNEEQSRVNDLSRQRDSLQVRLNQLNQQEAPLLQQLRQSQARLSALDHQLSQLDQQLAQVGTQLRDVGLKVVRTEQALKAAKDRGDQAAVARLSAELQSLESEKTQLQQKHASLSGERRNLAVQRPALEKDVNEDQARLEQVQSQVRATNQSLAQTQAQLRVSQERLANVTQTIQVKRQELASAQSRLDTVNQEIHRTNAELAVLAQKLQQTEGQLKQADQELERLYAELQQLDQRRQRIEREWESKVRELTSEQEVRDRLFAQYTNVDQNIQSRDRKVADIDQEVQQNQLQMNHNIQEQNVGRQKVANLQQSLPNLNQTLAQRQQDYGVLYGQYEAAETIAQTAEAQTTADYEQYLIRKNRYDQLLSEAKNLGVRQATPVAVDDGNMNGGDAGKAAGTQEGQSFGKKHAEYSSYINGLRDGQSRGKIDGYKAGETAPENYQKGFVSGQIAGKAQAEAEAEQVSYPLGRRETKANLLNKTLNRNVTLENDAVSGVTADLQRFRAEAKGLDSNDNRPFSVASAPSSEDADERVNALVRASESELAKIQETLKRLSTTKVLPGEFQVNTSRMDCQQAVVDFRDACKSSYGLEYQRQYKISFADSYLQRRNETLDSVFEQTRKINADIRFNEGKDFAYPIVFAKWEKEGAAVAEKKGYSDGRQAGYSTTIEPAKRDAYARGQAEETQYFATHEVVRVKSGSLRSLDKSQKLIPGAEIALDIEAFNFGSVDSKRESVRLTLTPVTNNIRFDRSGVFLVGIPGLTRASVRKVALGQISPTSAWNEEIRIQVRAEYSDGASETQTFSFRTEFGMNLRVSINTAEKPIIGGLFGIYINHDVEVTVVNDSPNPEGRGFRIVGVAPQGFPDVIFKKPENTIGALKKNESGKTNISYEIRNSSYAGKQIPLEVIVAYDGNREVARAKVTLVPVK